MRQQAGEPRGRSCVLLGGGGHAMSVCDVLARLGWTIALISGAPHPRWEGHTVKDDNEALDLARAGGMTVGLAVGDGNLRRRLFEIIPDELLMQPIASPTASVAGSADLGLTAVVLDHAHVGPFARIDSASIVNTGAIVEHDAEVGTASHVAPRACVLGGARIGERSLVGAGAVVLPGVVVGSRVVIGAGAVVDRDVPDGRTVKGVPAR